MSVVNKQVLKYSEVKGKILHAIDLISDPVRQTISPKGRNVLFINESGDMRSTNDGATIAKAITVADPVEDMIISVIKGSSLKTNSEAGDGTSTTILLSRILLQEGFKLIDQGMNQMEIKNSFEAFGQKMISNLNKQKLAANSDKQLRQVATVSANNDSKIADDILKVVKVAGQDGMVFLEPNAKNETEIISDSGFYIQQGMFSPELRNDQGRFSATYANVPVLVTDRRIYHHEEAESILKCVLMAGYKSVVIVARDFIGLSVNTFMANHSQNVCKVLLVKDPNATEKDNESLQDLATYLDVKLSNEKSGSLVDKLTIKDFAIADKVYADMGKTIIGAKKRTNINLSALITAIRSELDKDKNNKRMKERLAALTNGMVTLKIGGATQIQMVERIYRYEDALSATRAAMKDGYLVGGGVAMKAAFKAEEHPVELRHVFKKVCEANIRQIAENCNEHPDSIVKQIESGKKNFGYNAVSGQVEDLLKAGIIDAYKVTEMAITNSISIAGEILSSNYLIVMDLDEKGEDIKNKKD